MNNAEKLEKAYRYNRKALIFQIIALVFGFIYLVTLLMEGIYSLISSLAMIASLLIAERYRVLVNKYLNDLN